MLQLKCLIIVVHFTAKDNAILIVVVKMFKYKAIFLKASPLKLPIRLNALLEMIQYPYDHIWDCCCDHGYLGRAILTSDRLALVHFLDVVAPIVLKLEQDLISSGVDASRWQTHVEDLMHLSLPKTDNKQLLIIAGVGGDLTVELVSAVLRNNPEAKLEFLLSPVRQLNKVRVEMADLGLGLVAERLVKDAGRYYELIHISTSEPKRISPVGEQMWDLAEADHQEYLLQNIQHYQRMKGPQSSVAASALAAYVAIKK